MPKVMGIKAVPASIPYIDDPPTEFTEAWGVQLFTKLWLGESTGWGEVLVYGSGIVDAYIGVINDVAAKVVNGINIDGIGDVNALITRLEKLLFTSGLCGVVTGAISGVEMALLDALTRSLGVNLGEALGTRVRGSVPVYASFPRYSRVEDVVKAVGKAIDRGFTMVKLHQPPGNAINAIKAVREAFGYGLRVALDLNAPFSNVNDALNFVNSVHKYEPHWVEEPLWPPNDYDMLRELTAKSPVPIAAGENEYTPYGFRRLMESGVAYIQPDISKVGGVLRFMKIIEEAGKRGVPVAPHLRPHRSILAHAFTLQVASIMSAIVTVEWPLAPPPSGLFNPTPMVKDGTINVPSGPGVGVEVNEELLVRQYSYHEANRLLKFSDLEH